MVVDWTETRVAGASERPYKGNLLVDPETPGQAGTRRGLRRELGN